MGKRSETKRLEEARGEGQICRREEGEHNSDEEAEYHGFLSRLRRKIETPRLKFTRAVSRRCLAVKIILSLLA
ncbi:MAG: hypothetical protein N2V77_01410, partial [Canidatus Methanoxibalbensis ujae]|nr:hypothetical protein [Candidatus Methanoxibalbensis ujae]